MKRIAVIITVLALVSVVAGCSILSRAARLVLGRHTPPPTQTAMSVQETVEPAEPEATEAPEATMEPSPEATASEPVYCCEAYTSERLGIAFSVPVSWSGKYRVEEGDGYLTVCFVPGEPIDEGMGNFFTIAKKTSEEDDGFFDGAVEIDVGGVIYIFGTPTDVTYSPDNPEYETFAEMQQDLPVIRDSVRAAG